LLLLLLAQPIQWFYDTEDLFPVVGAYAVNLILSSIAVIPLAHWLKEFAHQKLFWVEWSPALAGGIVALLLAYHHYYLEALLMRMVLPSFLTVCFVLIEYHPSWRGLNFRKLVSHFKFGWPATTDSLINFLVRNLDDLLIGRTLGSQALGQYNRAYGLLLFPLRNFSHIIARSLLPTMRHWREDKEAFYAFYLKLIRVIGGILMPILTGCCLFAPWLVDAVLGSAWEGTIPLIQIFALLSVFQCIGTLEGFIFQGLDATRHQLKIGLMTKALLLIAIVGGVYLGQNTTLVALAYAGASMVAIQAGFSRISRLLGGRQTDLIIQLLPPIALSSGLGGLLLLAWKLGLPHPEGNLMLAIYILCFIAGHIMANKTLMNSRFREIQDFFNGAFLKRPTRSI
jgi:PST family polysaccharide transporter